MFLKLFLQKLRSFYLVLETAKSDCSQKNLQAYLNNLKIEPILSKFSLSLLQMSMLLSHFLANFRTVVTQNCLAGFFFNLLKTPSTTFMTFMFKWMSVTKAQVSQISSEILNGSGSRDLQKQVREKNWGIHLVPSIYGRYGPEQYHLQAKVSQKFYLYKTIHSRRCQVKNYLISKVYKKGNNKSFLVQWIKCSTSKRSFETYFLAHFAETYF